MEDIKEDAVLNEEVIKNHRLLIQNTDMKLNEFEEKLEKASDLKNHMEEEKKQKQIYENDLVRLAPAKKGCGIGALILLILGFGGFVALLCVAVNMAMNGNEMSDATIKGYGLVIGLALDLGTLCLVLFFVNRTKINNREYAAEKLEKSISETEDRLSKGLNQLEAHIQEAYTETYALNAELNQDADFQKVLGRFPRLYQKIADLRRS